MTRTFQMGQRTIGADAPVFLIGEVGSNHNNDLPLAKRLIEIAAAAGLDAVKFQSFRAEFLYPPNCGVVDTPMGAVDFYEVVQKSQLSAQWLPELKNYAEQCGLLFLSSPFDLEAVETLHRLGAVGLKIASPELNHLPLLRAATLTGLPLVCSTGLCLLSDIEEALATIYEVNPVAQVALLQCVSGYPTPGNQSNLAVIQTLHHAFGVPVGFSDHTMDAEVVPAIAVASGACLLEKHFTLDRSLPGPDHAFALEPKELNAMAASIRRLEQTPASERISEVVRWYGEEQVHAARGHGRKEIMPIEQELYPNDKRSIHAIRPIGVGEGLSEDNIRILRSERNLSPGLHPRHWTTILGSKATKHIELGEGVRWEHLLSRT